jgi:hypothetical protein
MENEITAKRGLILILVIATVAVFIGLVWLIATYTPWNVLGGSRPSVTPNPPRVIKNCTYPISYWMEHPELYPPQILFGSKVYQANEIREVLIQTDQDPAAKLQAQLVIAFLNFSSGADEAIIETSIFQAYSWLVQHPQGSETSSSDIEIGLRYFSLLEAYNLGLAGVEACQAESTLILTETTTLTGAPTIFLTITPSQTPTLTPSETPSPTGQPTIPMVTVVYPSATNLPTNEPTGGQPPNPTKTNAPPPTNTLIPPPTNTLVPPPTNTLVPPPTNTLIPHPTNTLVPPPTKTNAPPPTNTLIPPPTKTSPPVATITPPATEPATITPPSP